MTILRPKLFGEFFGCMMATTLALVECEDLDPAITVPGIKTGFRCELLRIMGLEPGVGADVVVYSEADPRFVRLHQALTVPALARATAAVLERHVPMADKDPRGLFEAFQSELKNPIDDLSEWAARFLWTAGNSVKSQGTHWEPQGHAGAKCKITAPRLVKRLKAYANVRWPATMVLNVRAEDLYLGGDLTGAYILLDPPYQGVTGYKHSIQLSDLLALARRLHAAGAVVLICESQSLAEMLGPGWHSEDITDRKDNQKRNRMTAREVVTMNRPIPSRPMLSY